MDLGEGGGTRNVPIWERGTLGRFVASSEWPADARRVCIFDPSGSRCRTPVCRLSGSGLAGADAADLVSGHLEAPEGRHLSPGVVAVRARRWGPSSSSSSCSTFM